jgi:hypothetical protein
MKPTIEFHILDYLRFSEQESVQSSDWLSADEAAWKYGLRFTDTAGLSLHLRDRLMQRNDFGRLPASIQIELEQRHNDNVQRTRDMAEEFIELNRMPIRYSSDCCWLLIFVEPWKGSRHDFLVTRSSASLLPAFDTGSALLNPGADADHLPGWKWKGNYFDPAIPRGVELHFQLWDSDFELLPIQTLDKVWERSCSLALGSIAAPTLCREHALLYVTLHAFRHLLRND